MEPQTLIVIGWNFELLADSSPFSCIVCIVESYDRGDDAKETKKKKSKHVTKFHKRKYI